MKDPLISPFFVLYNQTTNHSVGQAFPGKYGRTLTVFSVTLGAALPQYPLSFQYRCPVLGGKHYNSKQFAPKRDCGLAKMLPYKENKLRPLSWYAFSTLVIHTAMYGRNCMERILNTSIKMKQSLYLRCLTYDQDHVNARRLFVFRCIAMFKGEV